MSYLNKYIKKYWRLFFLAVSFLMLEALCDLLQPTIMSKIVDVGITQRRMSYVLYMGGVMIGVTALGAIAAAIRNVVSSNVSQKFGAELRSDLFRKVHSLSLDKICRFEAASLITRLTNDVTQVQNFSHGLMRIFVKAPLLCIGSIIMTALLNPRMALVIIIIIPIVGVLIYKSMAVGSPYFMKVQRALDRVNSVMREYLSGIRVVKAFNRFSYEVDRFDEANQGLTDVAISAMRIMAVFTPGISLAVNLGIIVVLWLGGLRVNSGQMQVGQVIAFVNYMTQILHSLGMISFIFITFVRAKASAERIGEVFAEENTMVIPDRLIEPTESNGRLDFGHVYFAYPDASGEPVLKDITFSCEPGETIGIIGPTGSGKSSLVNLITRFYDVSSGTVKVNGVDVKMQDIKLLRERIAVVPQKPVLFTGTVEENIRWGKQDASFNEVREAALAAQAHEFLSSFPEGYKTILGQGGVNLSGGQKQRVSIARALVRKPEILILDDSTSAVDVVTESKIREGLKKYSAVLTCIIIAQRITSVMEADRIVVLDNGEMVGVGTHDELMESCHIYQDIFHSQVWEEEM